MWYYFGHIYNFYWSYAIIFFDTCLNLVKQCGSCVNCSLRSSFSYTFSLPIFIIFLYLRSVKHLLHESWEKNRHFLIKNSVYSQVTKVIKTWNFIHQHQKRFYELGKPWKEYYCKKFFSIYPFSIGTDL